MGANPDKNPCDLMRGGGFNPEVSTLHMIISEFPFCTLGRRPESPMTAPSVRTYVCTYVSFSELAR